MQSTKCVLDFYNVYSSLHLWLPLFFIYFLIYCLFTSLGRKIVFIFTWFMSTVLGLKYYIIQWRFEGTKDGFPNVSKEMLCSITYTRVVQI